MDAIQSVLDQLRSLNLLSTLFRMVLGLAMGGIIGLNREHKRRAAGFRTYMLVCLGAVTTMLLSQFEYAQLAGFWQPEAGEAGFPLDVSRFGAQVINGIGFLGAGTIIVTGRQEVRGLTTAAGLWACACMGLAIGAGFYACVAVGFFYVFLTIKFFPVVERRMIAHTRNLNLFVALDNAYEVGQVVTFIKESNVEIYDIELQKTRRDEQVGVVLTLRLPKGESRTELMTRLSEVPCVRTVESV